MVQLVSRTIVRLYVLQCARIHFYLFGNGFCCYNLPHILSHSVALRYTCSDVYVLVCQLPCVCSVHGDAIVFNHVYLMHMLFSSHLVRAIPHHEFVASSSASLVSITRFDGFFCHAPNTIASQVLCYFQS